MPACYSVLFLKSSFYKSYADRMWFLVLYQIILTGFAAGQKKELYRFKHKLSVITDNLTSTFIHLKND